MNKLIISIIALILMIVFVLKLPEPQSDSEGLNSIEEQKAMGCIDLFLFEDEEVNISNLLHMNVTYRVITDIPSSSYYDGCEKRCCYPSNCPEARNNPENCDCMYMVQCLVEINGTLYSNKEYYSPHYSPEKRILCILENDTFICKNKTHIYRLDKDTFK